MSTDNDSSEAASFGEVLKSYRISRHLTQQRLADQLGVRRNTVGSWERGDFLPASKAIVLELARHLHLDDQEARHLLEASLTAPASHWSVPLPRNPFFTGREEILAALHTQLGAGQAVALTQSSVLHGLGGVGKTQIALEYAYRHALEYSAVFWIGAETTEQVVASLLHIAQVLQLPEREDKDQQRVVAAVQRWLSAHRQWLLIWDNVEELDLLQRFLPAACPGAVCITTRRQALGTLARGLNLAPMEQEEGIVFLLCRAKVLNAEATGEPLRGFAEQMPDEYAAARELVTLLGGLPLALDQAGAYIEETQCGAASYLQRYQQQRARLLDRRGAWASDHPQSVTTTFRLSIEQVERRQRAAADILRICAFLHAEAIPEELFVEGAAHLGPELAHLATDPVQFDQAIAILRDLSLVQRHPQTQTLSLHRLVQEVLRESLKATDAHQWGERTIQALNAAFPEPDFVQWERCERYISHAQTSLQIVEQAGRGGAEASALFLKAGRYLLERGRYAEADGFLSQAYLLEQQCETRDLEAANILDHLATLYWRQGKYQQAETLFQQALTACEQLLGPDHPETAHYLNDLALLYLAQGNYTQAEELQQRALTIDEHQVDAMSPHLAQRLENMARIFMAQGNYTQAEPLYRRALHIWESLPGPSHPGMTFNLNNLGMLYLEQEKYELAEPLLQRALTMRQQSLGPDHPHTANSLHHLSRLFLGQGKYEEAEQLSQRALHILEQRTEADSFYLANVLENLGVIYRTLGRYEQAEPLLMRALTIRQEHLGADHPNAARTLHELALLRQKQGNVSQAIELAGHALNIRVQALGDAHPKTVATQTLYAQLLQKQAQAEGKAASESGREGLAVRRENERPEEKDASPSHKTVPPAPSEDDPFQEFLDACCELHPRAWCHSADLWQAYQHWTEAQQERHPLSRGAFIAQLKALGCRADRTKRARLWRGIALASKNDDGG